MIGLYQPNKKIRSIVFSQEQAREAIEEFPSNIEPSTIHSMANRIVRQLFPISIGYVSYKDVETPMKYEKKLILVDMFNKFCSSYYLSIDEFFSNDKEAKNATYAKQFVRYMMNKMIDGSHPFTHDAYLKLASILINANQVVIEPVDILVLDEAGDASGATMRLFELYPATQKIFLMDQKQKIFTFLNLHDPFEHFKDTAKFMPLSTTYRCCIPNAEKIQSFMRTYVDSDFKFIGACEQTNEVNSTIYLSRFNATLVSKILEFSSMGIEYNLTRHPDRLFALAKDLAYIGRQHQQIKDEEFKYIEEDIQEYYANYEFLREDFPNIYKYLLEIHGKDRTISSTIKNIQRVGRDGIIAAYESAMINWKRKSEANITLSTAFSSKGKTTDKVFIMDDLNKAVCEAMDEIDAGNPTEEDRTLILLGYVAVSRAVNIVENCSFLDFTEPHYDELILN